MTLTMELLDQIGIPAFPVGLVDFLRRDPALKRQAISGCPCRDTFHADASAFTFQRFNASTLQ